MDPCLLPGENGERRPNLTRTLPCYPCRPTAMRTHRFHPAFQIKHHHGLYSSSVTTTLTALRRDLWYTDFHPDWWAEPAHSNTTVRTGPYTAVRAVTLMLLDQRRKAERVEVGFRKPHMESVRQSQIPRTTTA